MTPEQRVAEARRIRAEFSAKPPEEQARLVQLAEDRETDDEIARLQMKRKFGEEE